MPVHNKYARTCLCTNSMYVCSTLGDLLEYQVPTCSRLSVHCFTGEPHLLRVVVHTLSQQRRQRHTNGSVEASQPLLGSSASQREGSQEAEGFSQGTLHTENVVALSEIGIHSVNRSRASCHTGMHVRTLHIMYAYSTYVCTCIHM